MDFGRGIRPPKENSLQMQGPWTPNAPSSNPELTNRSQPRPLWLNSGAYSNGIAHQNPTVASNSIPGGGMQLNPTASADRAPDLARWRAAMAAQTQVSSLDPYMEALKNAAARLRGMPQAHLLSYTDSTAAMITQSSSNAANLRSPISNMQNNGGSGSNQQQQSIPAVNLLCKNQTLLQDSTPSSNSTTCCPPQMPQCK